MHPSTTTAKLDIEALLRSMPDHLKHYAGAAHRDLVAWHFCRTWQALPTAPEHVIKSAAVNAAWGWSTTPEMFRAASQGMTNQSDSIKRTELAQPKRVLCDVCGSSISVTKDGLTRVHRKRGAVDQCNGSQRRVFYP